MKKKRPTSIVQLNKGGIQLPDDAPLSIQPGETYPVEIEMLRSGVFQYWWREIKLGRQQLQQIIDNRNAGRPHTPLSFDLDHNPGSVGAVAWLDDADDALSIRLKTYTDPDGVLRSCYVLVGKVNLNSLGYSLVKDRRYKFFSVEMALNYQSQEKIRRERQLSPDENTNEYDLEDPKGYCLLSGALTNRPFIPDLSPISLSATEPVATMSVGDVLSDDPGFVIFAKSEDPYKTKGGKKKVDASDEEEDEDDLKPDDEPEPEDDDLEASQPVNPAIVADLNTTPVNLSNDDIDQPPARQQKDQTMKFTALLVTLLSLDAAAQIAKLDEMAAQFADDQSELAQLNQYRAMLQASIANDRLAREQTAKASLLASEKAKLEAEQVELKRQVMEKAQLSYIQDVELFAQGLRSDGHHEAPIAAISQLLLSVHPDNHRLTFSNVNGDAQFSLKDVAKVIFEALPEDARLSRKTDPAKVQEVEATPAPSPTAPVNASAPRQAADPSKPETHRTRFSAQEQQVIFSNTREWLENVYGQKFSTPADLPVTFWERLNDEGKYVQRIPVVKASATQAAGDEAQVATPSWY